MAANGLAVGFPTRLAEQLERRFGRFSDRAAELAIQILGPAVGDGDQLAIDRALEEIEKILAEEFPESFFDEQSRDVAASVDKRHAAVFFGAVAVAAGVVILGGDKSHAQPSRVPGPASTRRAPPGPRGKPKRVLGVKLSANPAILADQFATQNVALIKTLSAEVIPALRDEIVRVQAGFFTPGEAAERLAKKWAKSGVPVQNGELAPQLRQIVHNQVSRLNTQITKDRQTAAGIDSFLWISQRDGRVRPSHEKLDEDAEPILWSVGDPDEGLPGEPPGCRCFAEAVVDPEAVANAPGFVTLASTEIQLAG